MSSENGNVVEETREKSLTKLMQKGDEHYRAKQYRQALEIYNQLICIERGNVAAYIGKGNSLRKLGYYNEALYAFEQALVLEQNNTSAYAGICYVYIKLKKFDKAWATNLKAIELDPLNADAYNGKGQILKLQRKYKEALQAFEEAIRFATITHNTAGFYYNKALVLVDLGRHLEALKAIDKAIQLDPNNLRFKDEKLEICYEGYLPIEKGELVPQIVLTDHIAKGEAHFKKRQYDEALIVYEEIVNLDKGNRSAHLRIADIWNILYGYEKASEAYTTFFQLIENEHIAGVLWDLVDNFACLQRPAAIQFKLLSHIIINTTSDLHINKAFEAIESLYHKLYDTESIPSEKLDANIQALRSMLEHIPEKSRARTLTRIADEDDFRIAHLLIHLAPFSVPGLTSLAHQLTLRWVPTLREDALVVRFYHVLDSYNVPFKDSDWLLAQELMIEGLYIQAKAVLSSLVKQWPTSDYLWLFATAKRQCNDPVQSQVEILHRFIASTVPSDVRRGEAWQCIGDLSLLIGEGVVAIDAFKEAERYGYVIPQLQEFRAGNWDALPEFHLHPDYAFPAVVVIDLESDYRPDAALGSRVFEIGAVRVKGSTELAHCNLVIRRDFISSKVAQRQEEAIEPAQAIAILSEFIGTSIVVGHNLQAFDAPHLRPMGLSLSDDHIIDTLIFARWLHPDSTHHNLALLCQRHHIVFEGDQHTALPDARACAHLLHALGDELVCRGEQLLAGFRSFIPSDSVFDKAVLQPRGVAAEPTCSWNLNPSPNVPHILAPVKKGQASSKIVDAMKQKKDSLIERFDPSSEYIQHLPREKRTVVVVDSRTRLERMLALSQEELHPLMLPDPHTLLCPHRLREAIEQIQGWQMKLTLFCLYQASHNHDVQTLYPLRLPSNDSVFHELRQILLASCCRGNCFQEHPCSAMLALQDAIEQHHVILATHESFLHQPRQPEADSIIIDDADKLQMHFAEYIAQHVTSEQMRSQSLEASQMIDEYMRQYIQPYLGSSALYERLPLQEVATHFTQPQQDHGQSLLDRLKTLGPAVKETVDIIETLCHQACQKNRPPGEIRAYWLELHISREPQAPEPNIESWRICGVQTNIAKAFHNFYWKPYQHHILCGTAIVLGKSKTTFLTRFFGLPADIEYQADERPATEIYIPSQEIMKPASLLARRKWAESLGSFLYLLAKENTQSLVVSLQATPIANALAESFLTAQDQLRRQVLSLSSGWTASKIHERLIDKTRSTMAFIPPRLRETLLDDYVDIEATGPLRFLNQQDPLVAAHMRLFNHLCPNENPFSSYLLPQALLELKTRISSPASLHIILDSGLDSKVYRDEVHSLFQQDTVLETLPQISENVPPSPVADVFSSALETALECCGLSLRTNVDDATLHLALQTFWNTNSFRESPLNQKEVVRKTLDGEDQLVIAATGGGKSLCFQLPAILMAQDTVPKVTLVITPLIALMKDQVEALQNKGVFSAIIWNSTISSIEKQKYREGIKKGWYSIIYIAPEQIRTSSLRKALDTREIGLIAIDEAHCVSQWGHNFRTEYFALKEWIETHLCDRRPRNFPIIALTATARNGHKDVMTGMKEQGTLQDIIKRLGLKLSSKRMKLPSLERPELEFSVEQIAVPCPHCQHSLPPNGEEVKCLSCGRWCKLTKELVDQAKQEKLVEMLSERGEQGLRERWDRPYKNKNRQRGLIYCAYTTTTKDLTTYLATHPQLAGLRIAAYHGGVNMSPEQKESVYSSFINDDDEGLDIVVATNAFGMGIDVRRLGFIIHFDIPGTLEAYVQEAGRAGRDPEFQRGEVHAKCILLYHERDLEKQRILSGLSTITEGDIIDVYKALQKCRRAGQQDIFVATEEIELLTCIEANKIKTILYYLEHHTKTNDRLVLERGEDGSCDWELAFEYGYRQRLEHTVLSPLSQQLINVFQTSEEFGLQEGIPRMVSANELADYLVWDMQRLKVERDNLLRKHLIVQTTPLYIQWKMRKSEASELINQMRKKLNKILHDIKSKNGTLIGSRKVTIEIPASLGENKPFVNFLADLAHSDAGSLQLFHLFQRDSQGTDLYQVQLKRGHELRPILQNIHIGLQQTVERFCPCNLVDDDKQHVDLLEIEPEYVQRQQLAYQFLLLKSLGILSVLDDPSTKRQGIAMQVIFLQDHVSENQLDIDLTRLRLVELHNERKLELMREYATLPCGQRLSLLHTYFSGAAPLLEPFTMSSVLTKQQQEIVELKKGYHLVEGPAGSGKTTLLKEHVRYLVEDRLVPHDHILVVTHNKSAADTIGNDVNVYQDRGKTISTRTLNNLGESIFLKNRDLLLRPDGQPYYAAKGEVQLRQGEWKKIDEEEMRYVQEALTQLRQEEQYAVGSPLHTIDVNTCWKNIKRLRQHGFFPKSNMDLDAIGHALHTNNQEYIKVMYDIYLRYLLLRGDQGMYTYDDQILFALTILQDHPDIATTYQRQYEHIIVDEFQDLTTAEIKFICILSRKLHNIMAFGDQRQDIRVKEEYKQEQIVLSKRFEWSIGVVPSLHHLTTNYRSVQEILDLANAICGSRFTAAQLAAKGERGEKPGVIRVSPTEIAPSHHSERDMMQAMVREALHLQSFLPPCDTGSVALMVARSSLSSAVEEYLQEQGIPFALLGHSPYQSWHVKQILPFYRLIIDRHQDVELERLLHSSLSPQQIGKLKRIAKQSGYSMMQTITDAEILQLIGITPQEEEKLLQHLRLIHMFDSDSCFADVWRAINELPGSSLTSSSTERDEKEELNEVLARLNDKTIAEALAYIDSKVTFVEEQRTDQQLFVTTIDHAKSQAFDTVFLLGAHLLNMTYPNDKARLYVSVTRARQRLFFLINDQLLADQKKNPFLTGIPKELYEEISEDNVCRDWETSGVHLYSRK